MNPNPCIQNEINVHFLHAAEGQRLELTDLLGKKYYSEQWTSDQLGEVITIKTNTVGPGIYILSATGNGQIYRLKIVVH